MTDTEILNWLEENLVTVRQEINSRMVITWFDKKGCTRVTTGANLRDCVNRASSTEIKWKNTTIDINSKI